MHSHPLSAPVATPFSSLLHLSPRRHSNNNLKLPRQADGSRIHFLGEEAVKEWMAVSPKGSSWTERGAGWDDGFCGF